MLLTLRTTNTHGNARSTADAVITALSPAAWYRNATDVVSSGGFASIWADYASTAQGLVLPGVIGNYASAPDSVPLSITGSIDIATRVALTDWTPAAQMALAAKWGAGGLSYLWYVNTTTGVLVFITTANNATQRTATSSVAPTVSDGAALWLRVTRDSSSGDVKFYTAADSATVPASWTQLGTTISTTAEGIFDSTQVVEIGTNSAGGAKPTNGTVFRTIIKSGIDGTTVFDADFSAQAIGTASFTESSSNAATVTINTSGASPAHIGKARDLLQGTGTNQPAYAAGVFTFDGADNRMTASSWSQTQPETVILVMNQLSWASNQFFTDGSSDSVAVIWQVTATPEIRIYAGTSVAANTDLAVGVYGIVCAVFNGASSSLRVNDNAKTTGNAGASNMGGFTIGGPGSSAINFGHIAVKEAIVFNAALDDTQQSSVITALNNALTVF